MKTVYFILGMHRSGTSALTGTINRLGLDIGNDLMPTTEDNPKGYYENNKVLHLNEAILFDNNSDWDDCHFKILDISKEQKSKYVAKATKILKDEFRYSKQFCIKDPRNCLTFPIWEQASLDLGLKIKIIIPYRNPIEVASSLNKRDAFSFEKSLILWSHHFLSAEKYSRQYDRIFVSFNELLNETKKTINTLSEFVSVPNTNKKQKLIENFLDSSIKHNYFSLDNIAIEIPNFLQNLFKLLSESKFDNKELYDEISKDFYYSLEMFQNKDVMGKSPEDEEKEAEINHLKERIQLLEGISEINYLDIKYYEETNPDLSGFNQIELEKHYFEYGKKEGRYPNKYCELIKADAKIKESNQEIVYRQNNLINQYQTEVSSLESNKEQLIKEKISLEEMNQDLERRLKTGQEKRASVKNTLKHSLKEFKNIKKKLLLTEQEFSEFKNNNEHELRKNNDELKSANQKLKGSIDNISLLEKHLKSKENELAVTNKKLKTCQATLTNYTKQLKSKQVELLSSNKKLKSCLATISSYKNRLNIKEDDLVHTRKKLESCLDSLSNFEKQNEELTQNKEIVKNQLTEAYQNLEQANKTIINNEQKIKLIQEKNADLAAKLQNEINRYSGLDKEFNDAIEEIARIKECACWVYTKPFRILKEKITKGKE